MHRLSSRSNLHQEYAVGKASESIHLTVAIRKPLAGRPFTHHSRTQTYHECETVEEHVDTIAQESQRSSHYPIESLDEHEREVKTMGAVSSRRS